MPLDDEPTFAWQHEDAHLLAEILRVALSQDQLRVLSYAVHRAHPEVSAVERALVRPIMVALASAIDEEGYDHTGDRYRGTYDRNDPRPGRWPGPAARRLVAVPTDLLVRLLDEPPTDELRRIVERLHRTEG